MSMNTYVTFAAHYCYACASFGHYELRQLGAFNNICYSWSKLKMSLLNSRSNIFSTVNIQMKQCWDKNISGDSILKPLEKQFRVLPSWVNSGHMKGTRLLKAGVLILRFYFYWGRLLSFSAPLPALIIVLVTFAAEGGAVVCKRCQSASS